MATSNKSGSGGKAPAGQGGKPASNPPEAAMDLDKDSDGSTTGTFVSTGPAGTASASLTTAPSDPAPAPDLGGASGTLDESGGSGSAGGADGGAGSATAAVAEAAVMNLASVPAVAMGALTQSMTHSTGLLYENAVAQQQQAAMAAQAATMQGLLQIYSLDTSAAAAATAKLANADLAQTLAGILTASKSGGS